MRDAPRVLVTGESGGGIDTWARELRETGTDLRFDVVPELGAVTEWGMREEVTAILHIATDPSDAPLDAGPGTQATGQVPIILVTPTRPHSIAQRDHVTWYEADQPTTETVSAIHHLLKGLIAGQRVGENHRRRNLIRAAIDAARSVAGTPGELVQEAAHTLVDSLAAEWILVLEYSAEQETLIRAGGAGPECPPIGNKPFSVTPESSLGKVLASAGPQELTGQTADTTVGAEQQLPDGAMVAPIRTTDAIWGVLVVDDLGHFGGRDEIDLAASVLGDAVTGITEAVATKQAKRRFEAIFEQSPDILLVHDAAGEITEANGKAVETLGYARETLLEMTIWEIDPSADPDRSRSFWADLDVNESAIFESLHRRADGSEFPVEVHLIRLDQDPGKFLAIARDISQHRERERRLQRQTDRLELFVDALAHDVPNHLSVAGGYLDLARDSGDKEYFDRVEQAHERIGSLIEDLTALATAGASVDERAWVDIDRVAKSCWSNCCPTDEIVDFQSTGGTEIHADENRVKQLLENLFWNACEHGDRPLQVWLEPWEDGFAVADNGPGIPPKDRTTVMEPGFSTGDGGNTGLGLAIVKEIAEAHGWTVNVTESEAGGARFEFGGVDVRDASA